jgi:purine-binding chemotaxis protein CheW
MAESAPGALGQYVLFRLGEEEFGLPIEQVSGIIRYEEPTPVPQAPPSVDGVINLRGRVVPVVNLCRTFAQRAFEPSATSRIIVTESEAGTVGLAVDAANEVARVETDEIKPAPETALSAETNEAFAGVVDRGGRLVLLLRLDQVIPRPESLLSVSEEVALDG